MKKILIVFGTRPEAIKMCPLILELRNKQKKIKTIICTTGQHKEMLNQVLNIFKIKPDYDLDIMEKNQTLFDVSIKILDKLRFVLIKEKPDIVLVHGDTTTAFISALACFYLDIKIGHVEAGLRTNDLKSPFPEEFNRQAIDLMCDYYFAPTEKAKQNLLQEGKPVSKIYVTGNTGIDALKTTVKNDFKHEVLDWVGNNKLILITAHRRENIGESMKRMFKAIKRVLSEYPNFKAVYPIHMNPNVRSIANEYLADCQNLKIIEPLDVFDFHNFMNKSFLILTDSGGIQEEAPSLGKPVLVMRDTTERPEGVIAGTLKLVGTSEEKIYSCFIKLINDKSEYLKMSKANNPYGDGFASKRIAEILEKELFKNEKY